MRLVLSGPNARILSKAIKSFARISPELFIEAENDCFTLRGVNQTKSAYAVMMFQLPFFLVYEIDTNSENDYANKCKVLMKSCLNIFKNMQSVEECVITLDSTALKLIIQFRCRPRTVKKHSLSVLENEYLRFGQTNDSVNCIIASHKIFQQIIQNFQSIDEEITYEVKKDINQIAVKNYIEGAHLDARYMRSKILLRSTEFDSYQITDDTSITFCQRELRAILHFAGALNLDITMKFGSAGSPVIFVLDSSQSFQAKLVMSTLSPDAINNCTNQSIHTGHSTIKETKTRRKRQHKNVTTNQKDSTQVHQIPKTINLDDDDDDEDDMDSPSIFDFSEKKKNAAQILASSTINIPNKSISLRSNCEPLAVENNTSQRKTLSHIPSTSTNIRPTLVPLVPCESVNDDITFHDDETMTKNNNPNDKDLSQRKTLSRTQTTSASTNIRPTLIPLVPCETDDIEIIFEDDESMAKTITNDKNLSQQRKTLSQTQATTVSKSTNIRPTLVPVVQCESDDIEIIFHDDGHSDVENFRDSIPASPEHVQKSRKLKHIFRQCYEPKFDPRKVPGASQILAENSDPEEL